MTRRRELILNPRWAMELGHLMPLISLYEGMSAGDAEAQRTVAGMLAEARRLDRESREASSSSSSSSSSDRGYTVDHGVALVRFAGVVTKEQSCLGSIFGGDAVTTELIRVMDAIAVDQSVRRVMLVIDSPGGTVDGTEAAAESVYRTNQKKPITAYIDGTGCSAAWWIASQCSRVVGNATSTTASMGVYATLIDTTRAYENKGVKVRLVKSASGKGAGAPGTPVTDDQVAVVQREVNALHEVFAAAHARGRGVSIERARELADGEPHTGADAVALGFLDALEHYQDTWDALVEEANTPMRVLVKSASAIASAEPAVLAVPSAGSLAVSSIATPPAELADSDRAVVVAHEQAQEKEHTMSDPTKIVIASAPAATPEPTTAEPAATPTPAPRPAAAPPAAASPAPAPAATVTSSNDEVIARVEKVIDENQNLRERLAKLEKEKNEASTAALLKAHEDKFLPAASHVEAARTIAGSFPDQFALLMGAAKSVRPKAGVPVYRHAAGDAPTVQTTALADTSDFEGRKALAEAATNLARSKNITFGAALNELSGSSADQTN